MRAKLRQQSRRIYRRIGFQRMARFRGALNRVTRGRRNTAAMTKKPHRTNELLEIAVAAGARPATEEEYRAEEGVTSLVFNLPSTGPKKLKNARS